jgi:hypothetical protein
MRLEKIRIKPNSWRAKIASYRMGGDAIAMVWGRTILLHGTTKDQFLSDHRWVKHELAHVEQFEKYGTTRFLFLYLYEWLRHGYTNNRFEIEARKEEARQWTEPFEREIFA